MKKLLLMGINTRELINSGLELDYHIFSVSYFSTRDYKNPFREKHILSQKSGKSCGNFEENYSQEKLLEISKEYMDQVDHIILSSGISPITFTGEFKKYKKKILGNHNTKDIENKYKFYKKIKNKFLCPETYKINIDNISDAIEIAKQNDDKQFIVKPIQGFGGYGINYLNYGEDFDKLEYEYYDEQLNHNPRIKLNDLLNQYNKNDFLVQEYIPGMNISSSVLGTSNETQFLISSKVLTEADFGIKDSFRYCGNILPLDKKVIGENNLTKKNKDYKNDIEEISEDLIGDFNLIGSNGIDMIIKDDEIHIIEINPRFQGTYECIERILKINLLDRHIKACNGELIDIPKTNGYSIKKIIYSNQQVKIKNLAIENVYDIPYDGVIIEKDQPLATIISHENQLNDAKNKAQIAIKNLEKNLSTSK